MIALSACAPTLAPHVTTRVSPEEAKFGRQARILDAGTPLQCVVYARQITGMQIRGDAWTWWDSARDLYTRGDRPEPGAVLVLKRSLKSAGHLAVVTDVVNERLIIVNHANWLNDGRIHERTPVQDVSKRGDWSAVKVWYIPGRAWGRSTYLTYGFIYPRPLLSSAIEAGSKRRIQPESSSVLSSQSLALARAWRR